SDEVGYGVREEESRQQPQEIPVEGEQVSGIGDSRGCQPDEAMDARGQHGLDEPSGALRQRRSGGSSTQRRTQGANRRVSAVDGSGDLGAVVELALDHGETWMSHGELAGIAYV